jgi:hypothetical protein
VSPGRWGGGGAHPNGGTAERRRRGLGAAAFVSGEGSPVVAGVVEEVLQLERGEGVRKLQEIPGIGSSGRSLPGRGGRWWRSAEIRGGEAGSGGQRQWFGCGEWRGGSSARESGRRGVKNRVSDGAAWGGMCSAAARSGGEKGEGRGGPGRGGATWRAGARGVWSRLAGGAGSISHAARAGDVRRARTFGRRQSGRETPNMWAGRVTGGGVVDRWGRPVSGTGRAWARARACERA